MARATDAPPGAHREHAGGARAIGAAAPCRHVGRGGTAPGGDSRRRGSGRIDGVQPRQRSEEGFAQC